MIYSTLRQWAWGARGNAAVIFALMIVPIFAVSGFAIDASRQVSLKKHVRDATDAAAIAGARTFKDAFDVALAETNARGAFAANMLTAHGDADCAIDALVVTPLDLSVSITASCDVPTLFGIGISGKQDIGATVTSTAAAVHEIADVAMMFDLSASMTSVEVGHLKTAGIRAAQIIIGAQAGARGRVAIVPFASGVNAGDFGNKASGRAPGDDPENDNNFGGMTIERVCVTERSGAFALSDASPITGQFVGAPTVLADILATPGYGSAHTRCVSEFSCSSARFKSGACHGRTEWNGAVAAHSRWKNGGPHGRGLVLVHAFT